MIKYITIMLVVTMFVACSSSGGSSSSVETVKETVLTGQDIIVYPGDTVIPNDETTDIIINHDFNDTKTVSVLNGSITLIRGDYVVE